MDGVAKALGTLILVFAALGFLIRVVGEVLGFVVYPFAVVASWFRPIFELQLTPYPNLNLIISAAISIGIIAVAFVSIRYVVATPLFASLLAALGRLLSVLVWLLLIIGAGYLVFLLLSAVFRWLFA
jgi:hypothetical protein